MKIFSGLALLPIATYCSTATTISVLVGTAIREALTNMSGRGDGVIGDIVEEITGDIDGVSKPFIERNARLFGEAAKLKAGKDYPEELLKVRCDICYSKR